MMQPSGFLGSFWERLQNYSPRERFLIITAVLGILIGVVIVLYRSFNKEIPKEAPQPGFTQPVSESSGSETAVQTAVASLAQKKLVLPEFKGPWGRNPFEEVSAGISREKTLPSSAENIEDTGFSLTGVMVLGAKKVAIMSGKLVREGDKIGSAQLVKIEDDRVFLKQDGNEIIVRMEPS